MRAFFLPIDGSRRFCIFHAPHGPIRGAVLQVPAFAEEQNLARRMSALQASAYATAGFAVLQMDLFGCGDSEGEFGCASWATWIDDVVAAERWLQAETGCEPVFWGVRAGCLLATQAVEVMGRAARFLFWQPVLCGATHWRQFLRIGQSAQMLSEPDGTTDAASNEPTIPLVIEIAGYCVSPQLQAGLASARLDLPTLQSHVACIESSLRDGQITPALHGQAESWRAAGHQVRIAAVHGPAFWQTPEAPDCPALIAATTELLTAET